MEVDKLIIASRLSLAKTPSMPGSTAWGAGRSPGAPGEGCHPPDDDRRPLVNDPRVSAFTPDRSFLETSREHRNVQPCSRPPEPGFDHRLDLGSSRSDRRTPREIPHPLPGPDDLIKASRYVDPQGVPSARNEPCDMDQMEPDGLESRGDPGSAKHQSLHRSVQVEGEDHDPPPRGVFSEVSRRPTSTSEIAFHRRRG